MLKYNFVYITTNLINGKQYIGDHCTNNLNDNYLGSGILLTKKVKEYGRKNFKREILEFFSTKQEAFNAQEKYINEYDTLVPNGYNINPKGGHSILEECSTSTKQKQSNSLKGKSKSKEHKKHISESKIGNKNPMYGKTISEKTRKGIIKSNKNRVGNKSSFYGKHHSEETKQKISNLHKDTFYITNDIITKRLKRGEIIPDGWKLGRKKNKI